MTEDEIKKYTAGLTEEQKSLMTSEELVSYATYAKAQAQMFLASLPHVISKIASLVEEPAPYTDTEQSLKTNVDHLVRVREKPYWTDEDFTDTDAAITAGTNRIVEVQTNGVARPPSKMKVNAERNRRIAAGFTWNGNTYQSDADSLSNIAGAATSAVAFMVAGGSPTEVYWADPSQPFVWLTVDNTEVQMTPQDVVAFGNAAMAHKKNHIYAARTLKDMDPIPQDFTNEQYWP